MKVQEALQKLIYENNEKQEEVTRMIQNAHETLG